MDSKLTIIIPAYNEALGLGDVLNEVKAQCRDFTEEIIVVDDGSTDRTCQIAEQAGVTVIRHPSNKGYGASLKSGIRAAKTDYVLTMDADGQHQAVDVAPLWQARGDGNLVQSHETGCDKEAMNLASKA